jgi:hypothetical protein
MPDPVYTYGGLMVGHPRAAQGPDADEDAAVGAAPGQQGGQAHQPRRSISAPGTPAAGAKGPPGWQYCVQL